MASPQAFLMAGALRGRSSTTLRYFCQMPDIATPETSALIPWFPNQTYLVTRVAGELMRATDDSRMSDYLGEGPEGAGGILNRYLHSWSTTRMIDLSASSWTRRALAAARRTCPCRSSSAGATKVPIANAALPLTFKAVGLSDAIDATNSFSGFAMSALKDLIPNPLQPAISLCRVPLRPRSQTSLASRRRPVEKPCLSSALAPTA